MKKILFNVDLLDRHYAFYLDDETDKLYAYAIKKNNKAYFVTKNNEICFMNKIIDFLNKKYIRKKDVIYKNEFCSRYINRYNNKSYFAKLDGEKQVPIPYEDAKDLYDFYNMPKVLYIGRKSPRGRAPSYNDYDLGDNYGFSSTYNSQYSNMDNYNMQRPPRRNRRKST